MNRGKKKTASKRRKVDKDKVITGRDVARASGNAGMMIGGLYGGIASGLVAGGANRISKQATGLQRRMTPAPTRSLTKEQWKRMSKSKRLRYMKKYGASTPFKSKSTTAKARAAEIGNLSKSQVKRRKAVMQGKAKKAARLAAREARVSRAMQGKRATKIFNALKKTRNIRGLGLAGLATGAGLMAAGMRRDFKHGQDINKRFLKQARKKR